MFKRLRIKLTVLYAGLFGAALLIIALVAYVVTNTNAERAVREELAASSTVFDRVWQLRFRQMQEGAAVSARDYGFREAVATQDSATIASALNNLRGRLEADAIFLVTPGGLALSHEGAGFTPIAPRLHAALENEDDPTGVFLLEGAPHQAVSAPVYAPNLLGWIVAAERLDEAELDGLERLSAIPLSAAALVRRDDGAWDARAVAADSADARNVGAFIDRALDAGQAKPGLLALSEGRSVALVKPFRSLDGSQTVLLLRYSLAMALAPYRALFGALLAIGLSGLASLVAGTWLLARTITQPISALEDAARRLQTGERISVDVRSNDEIALLAQSFNHMSEAIKERERKITHLALHDAETRLPNRLALERRLTRLLGAGEPLVVAAIGVDRFAHIRGAIGYGLASALMRELGARLAQLAPDAPMARLATDALGLAMRAGDEADARARIARLLEVLEQPVSLDGQFIDVGISVGAAAPHSPAEPPRALVERANIALDQARGARAKLAFFDAAAYGDPSLNLSLMGEMRRALADDEIELFYQPKLDLRRNVVDGAEALVRWRHRKRGLIAPDLFVPMAEQTGHIRALTDWAIRQAVADQAALADARHAVPISVNVSGRVLGERDFARAALANAAGARGEICFEITETAVIENPDIALENLAVLADNGVRVSIDDYGSGLSSLAYLKQLPAHELKIDKIFVLSLTEGQRDALLVRSTIELAHSLGLKVVAEGVENPMALSLLAAMGCDLAQGYLIARPMPLNQLVTFLSDDRRLESLKVAHRERA